MRIRNVIITFIAVVAIIALFLFLRNKRASNKLSIPTLTPSIQQQIKNKIKGLTIPEDVNKIELKDVSGGTGMGLATRNEILADLPNLSKGQTYQGWLEKDGKTVLLGTLVTEKGGWILNYDPSKYSGYDKVIVTLGVKHILEGSF